MHCKIERTDSAPHCVLSYPCVYSISICAVIHTAALKEYKYLAVDLVSALDWVSYFLSFPYFLNDWANSLKMSLSLPLLAKEAMSRWLLLELKWEGNEVG